ncbi:succinyl-CoA:glutarate CoA-transferase isoform X2 [Sparus aurata]|uniref:succinyl-CoA:glutarate CoA-transferase isoform X1 n=1 Tax=Sparus aurata TaxID=8175 RepID=UPI0011C15177|nr:succinate--hydroxymethylglutarate CoA-transferase isoform X1 [Sparus aurata]XP_030254041.1 succinate--hydroxymethylglutarate CoA-transferase isoform X2 [Sparus aurata]
MVSGPSRHLSESGSRFWWVRCSEVSSSQQVLVGQVFRGEQQSAGSGGSVCCAVNQSVAQRAADSTRLECDVFLEDVGFLLCLNQNQPTGTEAVMCVCVCVCSGYGQTGPQATSPGYDSIASAVSGMMHITGPEDGEPVRPGVAMTDLATGLYAHGAIMAALLQRHKTRTGVHIDCNLLSSQVSCLSHIAANYLNAGKEARRWGTAHESIVPYQGFRTKDGHIVVAAGNDKQFVKVCQVLELVELADEPKYKTNKLRVQNRKELLHTLSQRFLQEKTADWLRMFEGSGVPVGPINSIQEVFSDPQVKHNGLILEMNHPTAGRIRVPGPAVRFSSFSHGEPTPPPLIGQHTVQVLQHTLSYSDDVIKTLLESRVVAQNEVS